MESKETAHPRRLSSDCMPARYRRLISEIWIYREWRREAQFNSGSVGGHRPNLSFRRQFLLVMGCSKFIETLG